MVRGRNNFHLSIRKLSRGFAMDKNGALRKVGCQRARIQNGARISCRWVQIFWATRWRDAFLNATISYYPISNSDHRPIILSLLGSMENVPRPFKFEAFWLRNESCMDVVSVAWRSLSAACPEKALFKKNTCNPLCFEKME